MAEILIVEDDRSMRLLTAARLNDLYTVVSACDGYYDATHEWL
jgi:CheY-like chemotaxis protein